MYHTFDIWQQKLWYMGKNLTRFFKAFFFWQSFFFLFSQNWKYHGKPKKFHCWVDIDLRQALFSTKKVKAHLFRQNDTGHAVLKVRKILDWAGLLVWCWPNKEPQSTSFRHKDQLFFGQPGMNIPSIGSRLTKCQISAQSKKFKKSTKKAQLPFFWQRKGLNKILGHNPQCTTKKYWETGTVDQSY